MARMVSHRCSAAQVAQAVKDELQMETNISLVLDLALHGRIQHFWGAG